MTPGARVQAAIDILDAIAAGHPAEKALTGWARSSRFAGSKDRAAVRDHVFDALRRWRSSAALGGGETGRARMIGLLRSQDTDLEGLFSGVGHAPAPLSGEEKAAGAPPEGAEAVDLPDWLWARFQDELGEAQARREALALRHRAPVDLRVNLARTDRNAARKALAADDIDTEPLDLAETALRVLSNPRRVALSAAYRDGLVELQDVSSQAAVLGIGLTPGMKVLDYCAGGGGKALAMAALTGGRVDAHDIDPRRMKDLPERAQRAGADIHCIEDPQPGYDLVFCDAPCSGAGTWRRAPEGKWRLTPERLNELQEIQRRILEAASQLVRPGGALVYATCSLLPCENSSLIEQFCSSGAGMELQGSKAFSLKDGGDGFYRAVLSIPS